MAQSSQADVDSTRSEISSTNARITECQSQKDMLQVKVDRLKEAKTQLVQQKDQVWSDKYGTSSDIACAEAWKGTKKDTYQALAEDSLISGYGTYYDETDQALDELNNEITRLENEMYDQDGVIGWLRSHLNSLFHSLENLLN